MIHRYLPYTLSLRAPVVLTSPDGDPNSSRTLPFIPGSALRGAAARGLGDPGQDRGRQREFRTLILDGRTCFLNAYPRAGARRTLPAPASLRVAKNEPARSGGEVDAWDLTAFSGEVDPAGSTVDWPERPLATLSERFVSIGTAQPLRVEPRRGSRIHQQRDRSRGRAWKVERDGQEEAHGAIFAVEFLEAGQELDGLVLIRGASQEECEDLAAKVKHALTGPILLGRSRRGGYGGDAEITWQVTRDREVEGQGLARDDLERGALFRALLTSAYIGRNPETGQLDPAHLPTEIVAALAGRARVVRRCWAFDVVGGFNRKWRLEVPQALACAAGSVLVLEATVPLPIADLLAVEHAGLGERRVEGFGRLVFLEAPARTVVLRPVPDSVVAPAQGDPPDLVRFAEGRILDDAVERAIAEQAARLVQSVRSPPTPSLVGRLRGALCGTPESGLATLRAWLGDSGETRLKRPAMDQLDRCRIGEDRKRLSAWLREMAQIGDGQQLASLLRLDAIAQRSHVISEESARSALDERAPWIRARLVDTTLAVLARRQRSGRSS